MLVYGVDPTDMSSLQKFDVAESLGTICLFIDANIFNFAGKFDK